MSDPSHKYPARGAPPQRDLTPDPELERRILDAVSGGARRQQQIANLAAAGTRAGRSAVDHALWRMRADGRLTHSPEQGWQLA